MDTSSKSTKELILSQLDILTKQGQPQSVLERLTKIMKNNPSDTFRPQLAPLVKRNHAYVQALRILHPIILKS